MRDARPYGDLGNLGGRNSGFLGGDDRCIRRSLGNVREGRDRRWV